MKTLKFKTNINCSGCIARVAPTLDGLEGINKWEVDTSNPNKILTIESSNLNEENVKDALLNVGFEAQELGQ